MTELLNTDIPEITWDKVLYAWKEYTLIRMSEEWVQRTWTPSEIAEWGLLSIEWEKIWCYWIPEEYLSFVLINEIQCSNVKAWKDLCLQALQEEIKRVPYGILDVYLLWRIQFFQNMEKFYQEIQIDEFYAWEMKKCYDWLISEKLRRETISEIIEMVWVNISKD